MKTCFFEKWKIENGKTEEMEKWTNEKQNVWTL